MSLVGINKGCIQKKGASLKSLLSHLCEELEENYIHPVEANKKTSILDV